jgi:hypothetical protein
MNHSGDAAEQMVRMSLEGVEVAAKITGTAAKEIALLLIAALRSNDKDSLKLRGKARLNTMLKSGKPLEIYSVKESDLKKFVDGAKEYGIVYCVLRNAKNNPDGLCDILVKADDAPKIGRLAERFNFATVDKARIESEIVAERAAKGVEAPPAGNRLYDASQEAQVRDNTEKLLDDLLGSKEGRVEPDTPEKQALAEAGKGLPDTPPFPGGGQRPLPSRPISDSRKTREGATSVEGPERSGACKPSVKAEIQEITAARKSKEQDTQRIDGRQAIAMPKNAPSATTHVQSQHGNPKPSKTKGSR